MTRSAVSRAFQPELSLVRSSSSVSFPLAPESLTHAYDSGPCYARRSVEILRIL